MFVVFELGQSLCKAIWSSLKKLKPIITKWVSYAALSHIVEDSVLSCGGYWVSLCIASLLMTVGKWSQPGYSLAVEHYKQNYIQGNNN